MRACTVFALLALTALALACSSDGWWSGRRRTATRRRSIVPTTRRRSIFTTTRRRSIFPTTRRRSIFPTTRRRSIFPTTRRRSIFTTTRRRSIVPAAPTAKSIACTLMTTSNVRFLNHHVDPTRPRLDDTAYGNIRQACSGSSIKRSPPKAGEPSNNPPGGYIPCTTLNIDMLKAIQAAAREMTSVQINALAGSGHSRTSRHYKGDAVDFNSRGLSTASEKRLRRICELHNATRTLGRGNTGHSGHVHCEWRTCN